MSTRKLSSKINGRPAANVFDAMKKERASAVTRLHNFCQAVQIAVPVYETSTSGAANQTVHHARVIINGIPYGQGTGTSKNGAKEAAAVAALVEMHKKYPGYSY